MTSLAPLDLPGRFLNAAGFLGWSPPRQSSQALPLDGFVTNPISLNPRSPAADACLLPYQGGFLLHNGMPNPGLRQVIRHNAKRWQDASCPVWAHLIAQEAAQLDRMVRRFEEVESITALEISLEPTRGLPLARELLAAAAGEKPFLAWLPLDAPEAFLNAAAESAAAGLVLGAPRGTLPQSASFINGRLYGPGLSPLMIAKLGEAQQYGFQAVVAGAGVWSITLAQTMLAAGADAVQWDGALWKPAPAA